MKSGLLAALCLAGCCSAVATASPLVVHEWGTFTSFQDEQGKTIGAINVDDEPVPGFVHRIGDVQVFRTTSLPALWAQGAPPCYPGVTLRLETPVIYFYPPADWTPVPFDVRATFIRGWLTEFYPNASTDGMNLQRTVDGNAKGTLLWKQLRLDPGAASRMPATSAHVWLAPRNVRASVVRNSGASEAEKYLFYRGIGNLDAPIVVRQQGDQVTISVRDGEEFLSQLPRLWLVDVAADGTVRLKTLYPGGRTLETTAFAVRPAGEQSRSGALRRELKEEIVAQGLFEDEADAMLETWRQSYFESPGLRLFFALPREWTDNHLPLEISTPAQITRVMVGRIELVSPEQRQALQRLYAMTELPQPLYSTDPGVMTTWAQGGKTHADLYRATNRPVPEALQIYESLGRFRDALLAHDVRRDYRAQRIISRFSACSGQVDAPQDTSFTSSP